MKSNLQCGTLNIKNELFFAILAFYSLVFALKKHNTLHTAKLKTNYLIQFSLTVTFDLLHFILSFLFRFAQIHTHYSPACIGSVRRKALLHGHNASMYYVLSIGETERNRKNKKKT